MEEREDLEVRFRLLHLEITDGFTPMAGEAEAEDTRWSLTIRTMEREETEEMEDMGNTISKGIVQVAQAAGVQALPAKAAW